jgi:serine/threonine-protein kinase
MLSPGTVVERYEVERQLGGGGMARVYKVRHVALGSVHALKVLEPELVMNAELRARFLEEGRIQARLRHPNIVSITDVVATPGVAGLVMEYLEGESLDMYLARLRRPPELEEVRDIFLQALEGVAFAHEQGIVHRDLKPSNLFLEQVRGQRVVRVLDFGIAKVSGAGSKAPTRTGMRMGTPQYMSPEQIRGARDVTLRSDIFSLGATLYELATGRVCFEGESDFNIMEKIVWAEYVPPEEALPGIDRALADAIQKALEPEPERRFGSCRQFAAALMAWGHVEPAPEPVARARPAAPAADAGEVPWTVPEPAPVVRRGTSEPVAPAPLPPAPLQAPEPALAMRVPPPPTRGAWRKGVFAGLVLLCVVGGVVLYGNLPGPTPSADVTRPQPEPAPVRSGGLVIEAQPAYRTVLELTDPRGTRLTVMSPYSNPEALAGPWRVVAKASGYQEERRELLVKPGESAVLRLSLSPRAGSTSP